LPIVAQGPWRRVGRGWRGRRAAPLLLLLWFLLSDLGATRHSLAAEPLKVPPMAPVERGEYRARDARTGEELWRLQWSLKHQTRDGNTIIHAREEGHGRRGSQNPTAWIVQIDVTLSGAQRRLSTRHEVRDLSGDLLEVDERELDITGGAGRVSLLDSRTGQQERRRFPLAEHSIGVEMLAMELRVLPDVKGHQMRFDLVTREGRVVGMEARIVGREVVNVPAGTFECYKVEVAPTGILGVIADLLLPKIHMWHTVTSPHIWVKYEGAEGGVGSREIVRELIRFEPRPG
jgi:hypothetical protein